MTYKSKYLTNFRKNVDKGKEGKNAGLPIGSPKLSRFVHGILPKRIILVAADTGAGKTSFVDDHFLCTPHLWLLDNPFHPTRLVTEYWSLEISPEEKIAKWCCAEIYKKYGSQLSLITYFNGKEDKLLDSDYIQGRALDEHEKTIKIKPEHEAMIDETMERLDALLENITFITSNPTKAHIIARLKSVAEEYGKFHVTNKNEILYENNNPNIIRQKIYDHIGLFKKGKEGKKAEIDDISQEWIFYRDNCSDNIIPISQFNRGIQDTARLKIGLEPQLADIKDTGNTSEDADYVIALFDPYRYRMTEWEGYAVSTMKNRFRGGLILKSRHSDSPKRFGYHFIGEVGMTKELPLPSELDAFKYQKLVNLQ